MGKKKSTTAKTDDFISAVMELHDLGVINRPKTSMGWRGLKPIVANEGFICKLELNAKEVMTVRAHSVELFI